MYIPLDEALLIGGVVVGRIVEHYARVAAEVGFGLGWCGGKCLLRSEAEGGK